MNPISPLFTVTMDMLGKICPLAIGCLVSVATSPVAASCGAAFCVVNTDWSAQGAWTEAGGRVDLRYEYIDLDQPRQGSRRIGVGEVTRHHDEIRTRNHNWVAALDWNIGPRWGVTLTVPYVEREHSHIHNHAGERIFDAWHFRGLGDVRIQGRYDIASTTAADTAASRVWGITLGMKLPTGKHDVGNAQSGQAERTLQPGTGTTDALVGAFWHGSAPLDGWSWFARAQASLPANSEDGYKPGRQLQMDAGIRHAVSPALALMLQANYIAKGRDSGANAEPADSGQRGLFVSPGASFNVSRSAQVYAFVQVPIRQSVNGVQLTADCSALAGVSLRF